MFHRFLHEAEFYPELSRLPLHVRMKLDITGINLTLQQWLAFSLVERKVICHLPLESDEESEVFVEYVTFLCQKHIGNEVDVIFPANPAPWKDPRRIPDCVIEKSAACGQSVTLEQWTQWQLHERYALYKTAVSKNEPEKFVAVLAELSERKVKS